MTSAEVARRARWVLIGCLCFGSLLAPTATAASSSLSLTPFTIKRTVGEQATTPNYAWFQINHGGLLRVDRRGRWREFSPGQLGLPAEYWTGVDRLVGMPDDSVWLNYSYQVEEQTALFTTMVSVSRILHVSPAGAATVVLQEQGLVAPVVADGTGGIWLAEKAVIGQDADGYPLTAGALIHTARSGAVSRFPIPDPPGRFVGAVASDGALWFGAQAAQATLDGSWTGIARFHSGAERRMYTWGDDQGDLVPSTNGAMWYLPYRIDPTGRVRGLCGRSKWAGYGVDSAVTDRQGRLWFDFATPTTSGGPLGHKLAYVDRRLAVHVVPLPGPLRQRGVKVLTIDGQLWLHGYAGNYYTSGRDLNLYRVDRIPAGKVLCRGLQNLRGGQ